MTTRMTKAPTQEELNDLCAYWQRVLRLMDWNVEIVLTRGYRMPPEQNGNNTYHLDPKASFIRIVHPDDISPDSLVMLDIERTIVHELLHLTNAEFFPEGNDDGLPPEVVLERKRLRGAIEQAMWMTAEALVRLNRGERPD